MKTVILFDLDGTLIDSTEAIYESFSVSFEKNKSAIPARVEVVRLIGHTLEDMMMRLGVEEARIGQYIADYKAHYRLVSQAKTILLPRAKEAIERAHHLATLGVVTTKTGRFSRELLEHFGLLGYFECVVGREDVKRAKPDSEPILKALSEMNATDIDKNRVFMIGDTPLDVLAAHNAGVQGIALKSGYASEEVLQKYTATIVNDVFEAICLIENSLKL